MQNNLHIDKTVRTNSLPFPWQAFMELGKESKFDCDIDNFKASLRAKGT